jgi:hypothetical protein
MQQSLASLAPGMSCEDFTPELAEILEPGAEVFGKLLVDLAAQSLGDGGAFSAGRDSDLQVATAYDRAKIKIAIWNVIDTVTNNIALHRGFIDRSIDLGRSRRRDDEELAVKVGGFEAAWNPVEIALQRELLDLGTGFGSDDGEISTCFKQGTDLLECNGSSADEQDAASGEIEKER